jgi:hypothetical protein
MSENFGQIPDKVRYNNELTFFARLIYTDILSLAKKENFCFATNQYFADLYNVSQKTVSISIKELEKELCISVELTKDSRGTYRKITPLHFVGITKTSNGMEENVKRGITKTSNGYNKNVKPVLQNITTGLEENVKPKEYITNNIEINIDNNIDNNIGKTDFSFLENDPEIISLNDKKTTLEILPVVVYQKPKKVKEKTPQIYPANFSPAMIRAVESFIEYRKEIKKPFKSDKSQQTKVNQLSDQIEAYGEEIVLDSIESAIANGWQGTFIDMKKVEQRNKQQTNFNNQFKTKRDETFAHYFNELRDVDFGFND